MVVEKRGLGGGGAKREGGMEGGGVGERVRNL